MRTYRCVAFWPCPIYRQDVNAFIVGNMLPDPECCLYLFVTDSSPLVLCSSLLCRSMKRLTSSLSVATMELLIQHDDYGQSSTSLEGWMAQLLPLCCLRETLCGTRIHDSPLLLFEHPCDPSIHVALWSRSLEQGCLKEQVTKVTYTSNWKCSTNNSTHPMPQ